MDVIVDSSQILADPRMQGAEFQILFRYLKQTKSSLVIPQVVREEVLARYPERLSKAKDKLIAAISSLQPLCFLAPLPKIPDIDVQKEVGFLQEQLLRPPITIVSETFPGGRSPLATTYVPVIETGDYSSIQVEELVRRAVERRKPASDNGEQFRDVILWIMTLSYGTAFWQPC